MHLTKADHGMLGSYAIVGAHLPMAVGAAWSAKLRGTDQVAVAFFGDGATNIGAFHEALNLAAVWKLPVLFVCENNLYMEYTPIGVGHRGRPTRPPTGRRRTACRPSSIDGNDVVAVHDAMARGRRAGPGRRRPDRDRGADLPALRAQPHRPGEVPAGRGGRALAGARPADRRPAPGSTRSASTEPSVEAADERAAAHGRRRRRRRPRTRRRRPGRGVHRRVGGRGCGMADLTHLPRGGRRGHRPRDAPRPDAWSASARTSARPGACSRRPSGCSRSSAPSGSGTRRSPSRRSSAPPWARR